MPRVEPKVRERDRSKVLLASSQALRKAKPSKCRVKAKCMPSKADG